MPISQTEQAKLQVEYIGLQHGFGVTPDHEQYLDLLTNSTFGVREGENVEERMKQSRERFRKGGVK